MKELNKDEMKEFEQYKKEKAKLSRMKEIKEVMQEILGNQVPKELPKFNNINSGNVLNKKYNGSIPKGVSVIIKDGVEVITYNGQELITKKVASIEVIKRLQLIKTTSIIASGGAFCVLLASVMSNLVASFVAVLVLAPSAYFFVRSEQDKKLLMQKYKIV